jgi:hypothetical protein
MVYTERKMLSRLLPVVTVPFFSSSSGGFNQIIMRQREERVDKSCSYRKKRSCQSVQNAWLQEECLLTPPHVVSRIGCGNNTGFEGRKRATRLLFE